MPSLFCIWRNLVSAWLRGRFEALHADLRNGGVKIFHERDVSAQVLQHIVNRIFKAPAGLVGGFDAFGDQLADFKAIHTLREGAMDLVGTHDGTPDNRWLQRGLRSSSGAVGRQQPSRLFSM